MKVKILALAFVWWASVQMTCAMAETYYYSGNARVYLPRWSATTFFQMGVRITVIRFVSSISDMLPARLYPAARRVQTAPKLNKNVEG